MPEAVESPRWVERVGFAGVGAAGVGMGKVRVRVRVRREVAGALFCGAKKR